MKKLIIAALVLVGLTCQAQKANEKETVVVIKTTMGTIKAKLYNDTPQHRDNFIKLVNEGWYNGSPFHRVINQFMIQGGQNADGRLDPGYRVPAEIKDNHFHKKGALCAARQPDQVNPQKASCKVRCMTTVLWICLRAVWARCSVPVSAKLTEPWEAPRISMATTPSLAKLPKVWRSLTRLLPSRPVAGMCPLIL